MSTTPLRICLPDGRYFQPTTERRALRAKVKALKHAARRQNGVTAIKSFREAFGSSEDEVSSIISAPCDEVIQGLLPFAVTG